MYLHVFGFYTTGMSMRKVELGTMYHLDFDFAEAAGTMSVEGTLYYFSFGFAEAASTMSIEGILFYFGFGFAEAAGAMSVEDTVPLQFGFAEAVGTMSIEGIMYRFGFCSAEAAGTMSVEVAMSVESTLYHLFWFCRNCWRNVHGRSTSLTQAKCTTTTPRPKRAAGPNPRNWKSWRRRYAHRKQKSQSS